MYLREIMITGLFVGIAGCFLGIGFAQVIGQTVFGSYIVMLLGSIPAIRYLMALKPTEVLHGK